MNAIHAYSPDLARKLILVQNREAHLAKEIFRKGEGEDPWHSQLASLLEQETHQIPAIPPPLASLVHSKGPDLRKIGPKHVQGPTSHDRAILLVHREVSEAFIDLI
jgi:hypothetical protein